MRCPCVFASSRSGIVFNPSTGPITDHSQSAKYLNPYFRPGAVEDPHCQKPNGLSKPEEQAHDRNSFLMSVGFETATSDRQSGDLPLRYRRAPHIRPN